MLGLVKISRNALETSFRRQTKEGQFACGLGFIRSKYDEARNRIQVQSMPILAYVTIRPGVVAEAGAGSN